MKKLWLISRGKIEEVEVIKETKKQFKLSKNISFRNTLNKSEIGYNIETYGDNFSGFFFDQENMVETFNTHCNVIIEKKKKEIDKFVKMKI